MLDWLEQMCLRNPEATPNIWLSDDYNITSIVKFPSKYRHFSQVSVKADFHPTITICSLEFAFLQRVMICDHIEFQINIATMIGAMRKSHGSHVMTLWFNSHIVWMKNYTILLQRTVIRCACFIDTVLIGQYQDIYMHFLISVLMSEFFKYYIALTNWCL